MNDITCFGSRSIFYLTLHDKLLDGEEAEYLFVSNNPLKNVDLIGLSDEVITNRAACRPPKVWTKNPKGQVPPPDGCSAPRALPGAPNDPGWFLDIDFTEICNQHDLCYSDCNQERNACDMSFRESLLAYCQRRYPTDFLQRNRCNTWARAYYQGVDTWGDEAYQNRQRQNCHCVCPSTPKNQ